MADAKEESYVFKILVLGDPATGKTAIIKRYVTNIFEERHKSTVGVDFHVKNLLLGTSTVRLQLWDIAGQDRYGSIARVYYKDAFGAMIVYDVTRPITFETVAKWKKEIDEKVKLPNGNPLPVVLLGNKCDLDTAASVDPAQIERFCSEKGFIKAFDVSAKANINIDKAARSLVEAIMKQKDTLFAQKKATQNSFQPGVGTKGAKSGGCC